MHEKTCVIPIFFNMKILQCIENDIFVNFNDVIRIVHYALYIESAQRVTFFTFEWAL